LKVKVTFTLPPAATLSTADAVTAIDRRITTTAAEAIENILRPPRPKNLFIAYLLSIVSILSFHDSFHLERLHIAVSDVHPNNQKSLNRKNLFDDKRTAEDLD